MANICNFSIKVKGTPENIEHFYNALTQTGDTWMGRGAVIDDPLEIEEDGTASVSGWCSWSIQSSLIDNAISMRKQPENWAYEQGDEGREFITLFEACERWNLVAEVYSEEPGLQFQEHYICDRGNVICDEEVGFEKYDVFDFDTKEAAEEAFGIKFTDEEWANKDKEDDTIIRGGFPDYCVFDDLSSYLDNETISATRNRLDERIQDASERSSNPSNEITSHEPERS
ncbi:MAG: hypothetical protein IJZ42_13315 [Lachnospiraceae bacterium]|nr:hypothetical protein [Lachnospiraceae bacterium]